MTRSDFEIAVGRIRLSRARRTLRMDGDVVKLGSRAFDLLACLAESPGTVVGQDTLIKRAWPDTFVDRASLRVGIAAIRRALGPQAGLSIEAVPGEGYRLCEAADAAALGGERAASSSFGSPPAVIFGRDLLVRRAAQLLGQSAFVTLVGPGGIGKTTAASAICHEVEQNYPDGVLWVDFSALSDSAIVSGTIARHLGLSVISGDPILGVLSHLRNKRILLVLDTCEHVLDAVADLAERIRAHAPDTHMLATSREPLRASDESVLRLSPLELAPEDREVSIGALRRFPASAMFLEHAANAGEQLGPADAGLVATICRRLDGLPMAIEIVAAHTGALGLSTLAEQIDSRFTLEARARQTTPRRHRTLEAALDWGYQLLPPPERRALQALSIFPARFSLNGAAAVLLPDGAPSAVAAEVLSELVSKSLVSLRDEGRAPRYRLLTTTRDYARAALKADRAADAVAHRHARFCLFAAQQAEQDDGVLSAEAWGDAYGGLLDDTRAALAWCFSTEGDLSLGVALTCASIHIWTRHALLDEHSLIIERALAVLRGLELVGSPLELKLRLAQGSILYHSSGAAMDARTHEAFLRALKLARSAGNSADLVRALSGLFAHGISQGDYAATHALASELEQSASGAAAHIASRAIAHNLLYMGRLHEAGQILTPAIAYGVAAPSVSGSGVHYAHSILVDTVRARLAWLQGRPDDALRIATQAVETAMAATPPMSLCLTLSTGAVFVASMIQDHALIGRFLELLEHHATRHSMKRWGEYAAGYRLVCIPRSQRTSVEAESLAAFVEGLNGALLESLAVLGQARATPELVQRALRGEAGWCRAELLRYEAMDGFADGRLTRAQVEHALAGALELAKAQGARSWELGIATDLAKLWGETGRREQGAAMLRPLLSGLDQTLRFPALTEATRVLIGLEVRS